MKGLKVVLLTALLGLGVFVPGVAAAQSNGTCSCNMGCHARPGQCVTSDNCATGYAPFCGVRADSCPQAGWVSCNGDCSCVAIPGFDAGVVDASFPDSPVEDVPGQDVISVDVPPGQDVISVDVPPGQDVVGQDVQGQDVQGQDVPPGQDVVGQDVPPGQDVVEQDVPPVCTNGVVVDGVCYTEHCQYDPEVGFFCSGSGYECRSIDGMAWCVPICAAKTCAAGEVCDPTLGCVPDMCSMIACPPGEVCMNNHCVAQTDGGGSDGAASADGGVAMDGGRRDGGSTSGDGAASNDGAPGGDSNPGNNMGGCGCRTAGVAGHGGAALTLLGLAALAARRRRRK